MDRPFKTLRQYQQFARAMAGGARVGEALVLAGYSPKQAKKGWTIVRRCQGLRDALAAEGGFLVQLGNAITAEEQEALVRGRLVLNTILGKDRGVASARTLGSDRRVAMWQPESATGVVVLVKPDGLDLDGPEDELKQSKKQTK